MICMNLSRMFSVGVFGILFLMVLANVGFADTTLNCSDTDGGNDEAVKGTITLINASSLTQKLTDVCGGASVVQEYSCDSSVAWKFKVDYLQCPSGTSCKDGACVKAETPAATCTDSDGGEDHYTKGSIKANGSSAIYVSDSCSSIKDLLEWQCQSNGFPTAAYYACPLGTSCKDGACVKAETTCADSDGGKVLDQKGTVSIKYSNGSSETMTDLCSSSTYIVEYACNSSSTPAIWYPYNVSYNECPSGTSCTNGACVKAADKVVSCSDSDGGKVYDKKGTITIVNSSGISLTKTDECSPSDAFNLYERYCSTISDDMYSTSLIDYTCPSGTSCKDGACVKSDEVNPCTDTDGGKNVNVKGTATDPSGGGGTDSCWGDSGVWESYCIGSKAFVFGENCANGETCKDGACVSSTPASDPSCNLVNPPASTSKKNKVVCANGTSVEDYCLDNTTIVDYKVSNKKISQLTVKCGTGKVCDNGACKKKATAGAGAGLSCNDSDNGIATAVKGFISYTELYATEPTVEYDECKNANTVKEKYCSVGKPKTKSVKCPAGFACTDGACVEESAAAGSSDTSGELKKKSILREFLMAAGFDDFAYLYAPSTDAKSRMAKSWKIGKGNILSEIFLYDFEPVEIANPPE